MGILDSVTEMFGGEDSQYEYVCNQCDAAFESAKADMSEVSCPECRSTKIRSATT